MKNKKVVWSALLLVAAALVGCGSQLVQAWSTLLGTEYVHALWVSSVDGQINLLKTDEASGARIERFDTNGQLLESNPVSTSGWTGANLVNPQDDSVFLLERVAGQTGAYNLVQHILNGVTSRVSIDLPPLASGRHWQVDGFKNLTSDQHLIVTARIRNGSQTEDERLLLLSGDGETLSYFSTAASARARVLALDNGFVWIVNCSSSAPDGGCVMRFVVLDEHLQILSDSQSMHGDFAHFSNVSLLGDRLVISGSNSFWLVDLSGNVERELDGLDGRADQDNRFYPSANGAYALLTSREKPGYNLCRLNQLLQTQWCNVINEMNSPLWGAPDLDYSSLRAFVDERERFQLSFLVERIYSGIRGSLGPVPAPGVGLSIELVGTRELDVHHVRYAADGRKLPSAKENSYSEHGVVTVDWWSGISIDPEQTTAGVCGVSRTTGLPDGSLLALNHFCEAEDGPYRFQLTRWK